MWKRFKRGRGGYRGGRGRIRLRINMRGRTGLTDSRQFKRRR